jgi:uncharacterized protein (DUF4415 family)
MLRVRPVRGSANSLGGPLRTVAHQQAPLAARFIRANTNSMAKSIRANTKKKRGRPKTTGKGEMIGVRLHGDLLKPLDRWIADQPKPKPSRPDAMRTALAGWLAALGLIEPAAK